MSELQIVPAEVHSHASEVSAAGSKIGSAVSAGGQVTAMSPEAFGLLCGFFTPPVLAVSATAIGALSRLQSNAEHFSQVLPQVASEIEDADQQVGEHFTALQADL